VNGVTVEVKIGMQNVSREVVVDVEMASDDVEQAVVSALTSGPALTLVDSKGRKVMVASDKVAYVEIGSPTAGQVGFRS
jgi:hypothetical protein